ncbi:MAG: hypothetical protein VX498_11615 [Myxococcota bacterium]|nr:hypothetical protein [Myxococcota bacterium]
MKSTLPWSLLWLLPVLPSLGGCPGNGPFAPGEPNEWDCIDMREDWGVVGEDQYQILVPTMVVEPWQEIFYCYYGTYEGPDVGVVGLRPEISGGLLHHSLLKRVDDNEFEDGALFDCSSEEFQFPPKPTLFEYVGPPGDDPRQWIHLPDGIGFKLEQGQRWLAEAHYVNPSDERYCFNTAFDMETIPAEEVVGYAGTYNLDAGGFELPPGETSSESFGCAWPNDLEILSLGGHMHGYGASYTVDWHNEAGEVERVYNIPDWLPSYRYESPITNWSVGEVSVSAGDVFETTCTWFNDSDHPLSFPDEMCTTFGVAYPLETSFHCDAGDVLGP